MIDGLQLNKLLQVDNDIIHWSDGLELVSQAMWVTQIYVDQSRFVKIISICFIPRYLWHNLVIIHKAKWSLTCHQNILRSKLCTVTMLFIKTWYSIPTCIHISKQFVIRNKLTWQSPLQEWVYLMFRKYCGYFQFVL